MDDISPNRDASEADDERGRQLSGAFVAARQKGPADALAESFADDFSLDDVTTAPRVGVVDVTPAPPADELEPDEPEPDEPDNSACGDSEGEDSGADAQIRAEFIGPVFPTIVGDSSAADPAIADLGAGGEDAAPALTEPGEVAKVAMAVLLTVRDGLTRLRLAEACNTTQKLVDAGLDHLEADLRHAGLPLAVRRHGESIRLMTLPEVFPYLQRLKARKRTERLSPAALETLAVIAYRQPVIRAEIEAIRGVKVGPMLRTLLEHNLVGVVGRKDVPGRPLQYGTTQQFLDRFGLASLAELPSLSEFRSLG